MKRVKRSWFVVLVSLAVLGFNATGNAAEIIYQDDISQNLVTKDVLVRTADNAIVLIDASGSMGITNPKYKKTYYEMEKDALSAGILRLPDLGYNIGFYTFCPSWKEIYPVQKFDRTKLAEAMKQLPDKAYGGTPLVGTLDKLEGVLKGLSGRTVVYIFSDGGHEQAKGKDPVHKTAELARAYNACFIMISYGQDPNGIKRIKDMSMVNSCSRVIPFDAYITNPYYATGILYYKKSTTSIETTSKQKINMKVNDIRFDYDKFELTPQEKDELNQLGKFLYANPQVFAAVQGFTDNRGTLEYNLELSRRRAEMVADYLMKNFKLDAGRVAVMWYGEGNPVDSNNTAEGRAKNRRVEIAVSSLSL